MEAPNGSAEQTDSSPDSKNALPLSGNTLPDVNFDKLLQNAKEHTCRAYSDLSFALARTADGDGRKTDAALMQSLGILLSFAPNYENSTEPYRPEIQYGDGRRSLIPDDLGKEDLILVRELFSRTRNTAIRSRLGDILWIKERDHKIALSIIQDYIDVGRPLLEQTNWREACPLFRRSLQIGNSLGRKNAGWQTAAEAFIAALDHPSCNLPTFGCISFLHIALDLQVGDTLVLAEKASGLAQRASADNAPNVEREFRNLEIEFWRRCKEFDKQKAASLAAAMTHLVESEAQLLGGTPSYMAASGLLVKGIEALRQANADPAFIAGLRQKLQKYQQESLKELGQISMPDFDISDAAEAAQKFVERDNVIDALKLLAFGHDLINVEKHRKDVLKRSENAPLSYLINTGLMDKQGRVEEKLDGLFLKTGDEFEKCLEGHMFHQAAKLDWRLRAAMFIEPARLKIWLDHRPTASDMRFLVTYNPFIPPGHEHIFLQGLFYGLTGDLILSSHLLTPQLENSIRHVLQSAGVDVSNINADLTQPVKILGPLFDLPEMKKFFGPDMCFELRGHLIEKSGFAFRNQLAHGFISDEDCYSEAALSVWWLTLRLCFHGLYSLGNENPGASGNEE